MAGKQDHDPLIVQGEGDAYSIAAPSDAPTLIINQEWELHTCKRGHVWRLDKMLRDPFVFTWTGESGTSLSIGSGPICLRCWRDDLASMYGPVKTVAIKTP